MKNSAKLFGIIAFTVVMTFLMTGCSDGGGRNDGGSDNNNNNNNNNPNGNGGTTIVGAATLTLSGQVYFDLSWSWSADYAKVTYTNFNGDLTIYDDGIGGSGSITDGKLSYSVGTPNNDKLEDIDELLDFFRDPYSDVQASNMSAKYSPLVLSANGEVLYRGAYAISGTGTSYSGTDADIYFIYVDRDVTITAKGDTILDSGTYESGVTYKYTATYKAVDLKLKAGWNAVSLKDEYSSTTTGTWNNPISYNSTSTFTVFLNNPNSAIWMLNW